MMKHLFLILLLIISLYAEEKISFYKNGNLMWLIDKGNTKSYDLRPIQYYIDIGESKYQYESYESYLNKVNSRVEYKYKNWRLPTLDELLTLDNSAGHFRKLFASKQSIENDICIDTDIFYDVSRRRIGYATSTKADLSEDGKQLYYYVDFTCRRYPYGFLENVNVHGKSTRCVGIEIGKSVISSSTELRLVRDID